MDDARLELAILTSLYKDRYVLVKGPNKIALVEHVETLHGRGVYLTCRYPGEPWNFRIFWQDCTLLEDHSQ